MISITLVNIPKCMQKFITNLRKLKMESSKLYHTLYVTDSFIYISEKKVLIINTRFICHYSTECDLVNLSGKGTTPLRTNTAGDSECFWVVRGAYLTMLTILVRKIGSPIVQNCDNATSSVEVYGGMTTSSKYLGR